MEKTATLVLFCFYHEKYGPSNDNEVSLGQQNSGKQPHWKIAQ